MWINKLQSGLSFLEVLTVLLLLSFSLLTLAKIQMISLINLDNSLLTTIATARLETLIEKITIHGLQDEDVITWNKTNRKVLPNGQGKVYGINPYTVELSWMEQNGKRHALSASVLCS